MTKEGFKKKISFFIINTFLSTPNEKLFKIKRYLLIWSGIKIGKNTKIVGPLYVTGNLILGENVWIGTNFKVRGNGTVQILNNCDVAPDVSFITGTHEIGTAERRAGIGLNKDIIIESGTWIGANSKILGGVTIGKGCVIAAGSLVNKNVYQNQLVGGVPAKTIRELPVVEKE